MSDFAVRDAEAVSDCQQHHQLVHGNHNNYKRLFKHANRGDDTFENTSLEQLRLQGCSTKEIIVSTALEWTRENRLSSLGDVVLLPSPKLICLF